ncbi:MAG TPA: P-loop NTPase fold protein [Acidocella sp.]|jgi:predicted KAP-like P-loop ATPase|uniref:KAP family P-loop NTPase fold protein n=1 Tax=Acidocella sp. TaxID=50710 RepID=UPI002C140ABF|nr:P-loop NTPase fold protein [Acidocella sp.]HVE23099.1 P-loop NTPase fold protein [Acidocella sp.]
MWADVETGDDLLNYGELAEVVANMLDDPRMLPLSIGISGGWGTGKSSMLKLIETKLQAATLEIDGTQEASAGSPSRRRFIVVHYDAWLYQGFDDARAALMETIATCLVTEAENKPKSVGEKALSLFRRVDKLRALGAAADGALMLAGVPTLGAVSKGLGAISRIVQGDADAEDVAEIQDGLKAGRKRLDGVLRAEEKMTPPQEIQAFRAEFAAVLADLNAVLVVFIDNLDRCLPAQVIHTLEALRLFLFMGNSAFCIAADEDMVRHSVRKHFDGMEGEHVRDYLDKLIQVPIRVPRLGIPEITSYLMQLFAEIHPDVPTAKLDVLRNGIRLMLQQSWNGDPPTAASAARFVSDPPPQDLLAAFELAERMAPLLANASAVNGNPRIIKRLLNTVRIRAKLAAVRKVEADETIITKLALFERCMGDRAAASLYSEVLASPGGTSDRIRVMQEADKADFKAGCPEEWHGAEQERFLSEWVSLEPQLSGVDLRGVSALSRDSIAMVGRRRGLSAEASQAMSALSMVKRLPSPTADKIAAGIPPAERADVFSLLMTAMRRQADWNSPPPELNGALVLAKLDPAIGRELRGILEDKLGAKPPPYVVSLLRQLEPKAS